MNLNIRRLSSSSPDLDGSTSNNGFFVTEVVELLPVLGAGERASGVESTPSPISAGQSSAENTISYSHGSAVNKIRERDRDREVNYRDRSLAGVDTPSGRTSGLDHASLKRQKINMGSEEVKRHNWFIGVNWNDVYLRKLTPPYVPDVVHEADTQNFEKYDSVDLSKVPYATDSQIDHFKDF